MDESIREEDLCEMINFELKFSKQFYSELHVARMDSHKWLEARSTVKMFSRRIII